jgi:hypothetical protein
MRGHAAVNARVPFRSVPSQRFATPASRSPWGHQNKDGRGLYLPCRLRAWRDVATAVEREHGRIIARAGD